jgi:hypothetical protein
LPPARLDVIRDRYRQQGNRLTGMEYTKMHARRSKRTKKIIIGAVLAGVAALGTATALPASAATENGYATTISGTGPTASAAQKDALRRCFGDNYVFETYSLRSANQNADGSWSVTIEGNCK